MTGQVESNLRTKVSGRCANSPGRGRIRVTGVDVTKRTCSIQGCEKPERSRSTGWCSMHYTRWKRHGDPHTVLLGDGADHALRFAEKVTVLDSGCFAWGESLVNGYGTFYADGGYGAAHRYAYELFVGPIPDGMQLDHLCHTEDESCMAGDDCPHRACVNPDHLEPVTPAENAQRAHSPFAAQVECAKGHPYDDANTYERKGKRGGRNCRECAREAQRRYRARLRGAL